MTLKEITKHIASHEAKLKQVSIGNIREMLGILSDMAYDYPEVVTTLILNGKKRLKKRAKST
jgi:hypothetical protein